MARVAGAVLLPCWLWLLGGLLFGVPWDGGQGLRDGEARQDRRAARRVLSRAMWPGRSVRIGLGVAGILCAAVVIGGFVVGAGKGDGRVLPGPQYEISTSPLNQAEWTPVSAEEYTSWQARFVRGDGVLTIFGLMLTGLTLGLLQLHRTGLPPAEPQLRPPHWP
jgi:hypothetical protein